MRSAAFASWMTPFRFPSQPAWSDVALANPDELVLLGDSVYYDADGASMGEVKAMNATTGCSTSTRTRCRCASSR